MEIVRYPTVGGLAGWRVPALATGALIAATLAGHWPLTVTVATLAIAFGGLERSIVVEVAPAGLSYGLIFRGAFVGAARVLPWRDIVEVETRWRGPRDRSALDTLVWSRDGSTLRFSSRMGVGAYRSLVADIVRRRPDARRTGLTDQLLAEAPSRPGRPALSTAVVAAGVALALLALIG